MQLFGGEAYKQGVIVSMSCVGLWVCVKSGGRNGQKRRNRTSKRAWRSDVARII